MHNDRNVGIVGTGRMGANIARRLKDVGYTVVATYDAQPDVARTIAREVGAQAATSLARVTALADVVITVVSDDAAMEAIFGESGDSLLQACDGKIFVNCATVTPNVHVAIERRSRSRGAQSLEACMASSIPQARDGHLYLMCGGDRAAFDRVRPMLEKLSASLIYVGGAGSAAQVKALVNMVMNINTAGLAEGLGLGAALDLDLDLLRDVFAHTGANSRVLATDGEDMQNRDHDTYFSAEHAAKDSGIALSLAKDENLLLPLARATFEQYEKMKELGLGGLDKSGVSELTFPGRHAQRLKETQPS